MVALVVLLAGCGESTSGDSAQSSEPDVSAGPLGPSVTTTTQQLRESTTSTTTATTSRSTRSTTTTSTTATTRTTATVRASTTTTTTTTTTTVAGARIPSVIGAEIEKAIETVRQAGFDDVSATSGSSEPGIFDCFVRAITVDGGPYDGGEVPLSATIVLLDDGDFYGCL